MMAPDIPKKEARPALVTRYPGEYWNTRSSYPSAPTIQGLGEQFAERWQDAAACFTSALFRALTDPPVPALEAVLQVARGTKLQLYPGDFPSVESWSLVSIMCDFSEHKVRPSIEAILRVAREAGIDLPGGGGDPLAELRLILEYETSAAGIQSWARELQFCARKHRQVARLWRVLRGWIEDPLGDTRSDSDRIRTAAPPPTRRFSGRALAAVRGGA